MAKLKIIDLDIDEALSAETKVDEVAWVLHPAIDTEFIYFTTQEFEDTLTDYPQYITDTAKKAKKWVDINGYGGCMTPVGKRRLSQLANREPLSILTLKRMKAYGDRHRKDWQRSKSFDDGCGYLALASWGFEPDTFDRVMNWLEREINKAEMELGLDINLPPYTSYPTGDTENDMLVEPVEFIEKVPYERKEDYISRCVAWHIKNKGWDEKQSYAVCVSQADEAFCGCSEEYAEVGERGGIKESKKAPKSDTPNPNPKGEGTAKGDAGTTRGAEVTERVEKILKEKSDDFNERYKDKLGYGVNVGMLKAVYQRGIGAYNVSHSPEVKSGEQWALARVNAFLYLVKEGRPENKKYTGDNDLLPKEHPKSDKQEMNEQFNLVGFVDGEPIFSTPIEAEMYGEETYGCSGHHTHTDENGNEVYMACETHPTYEEEQFSLEDYSEEELELVKLLKILGDTDYQKFEAVIGGLNGATKEDIIARNHKTPTIYFQYQIKNPAGPPDRNFCTSIEGRYFRRLEIDVLRNINNEFGHNREPYSKWLYKGGALCKHAWRKFLVQGKNFSDEGWADGKAGMAPREMPGKGFYPGTPRYEANLSKQQFKADTEKRMLYTPLMLANVLIPRVERGEKYYVRFKPEVIEKIAHKFLIEQRQRATNLEHTENRFNDIVMVESWIVSGKKDKIYELGFTEEQVPVGSWVAGYKVLETEEGDMIWNDYIKSGVVRGASVQGEFILNYAKQAFSQYDEVLKQINDIVVEYSKKRED